MISHEYAAGLLDGEGTITLSRLGSNENRAPIVSMTSTTKVLCEVLKERYGGSISHHTRLTTAWREAWSWKVAGRPALKMLEDVLPFLHEPKKAARAQTILAEYDGVTVRNGKYRPEQLLAKRAFEDRFFAIA